jgi:hypothetical protein
MTMIPDVPVPVVPPRPLERVEADLVRLATQLTTAMCTFLRLVGEYDQAEGWRQWGMNSTAAWLSWHCGVGMAAGYEQVRVARVMRSYPALVEAFAAGRLSYSKVRAITRIITVDKEGTLIGWAEHCTAAQLERIVAGTRRAIRNKDARACKAARSVMYRWDDDGSLVGSFRLPPEDAVKFLQGLDVAKAQLVEPAPEAEEIENAAVSACQTCLDVHADAVASGRMTLDQVRDRCPDVNDETPPRRRGRKNTADALVFLAEHFVTATESGATGQDERDESTASPDPAGLPGLGAERFQLVIHSSAEELAKPDDADDLSETGSVVQDGPRLHPSTARRLACGCAHSTQIDDKDGNPLHLGRTSRRIRRRLARAVHRRDHGHCQAPGCAHKTTQIHHIIHWANGGVTCITNLISLCDSHHWLVHEGGWHITTQKTGWLFHDPDHRAIPTTPPAAPIVEPLPSNPEIAADAVTGKWGGEGLNLPWATSILLTDRQDAGHDGVDRAQ